MRYRKLGSTGLEVSALGFGAASLGGEYGALDPAEGERAVHCALDLGITYFDVAPYYGGTLAESRLGIALDGKRNKIVLATKVGRNRTADGEYFDFSAKAIRSSIEDSLRRLNTDTIDVLQAHDIEFVPIDIIVDEAVPEMKRLQRDGKIRFIGITAYPVGILKKVAERVRIDTILSYCRYNLLDTTMDKTLTPFTTQQNIGLINASPLHMGALSNRTVPAWHPAPATVLAVADQAAQYCEKQDMTIADVALHFAYSHPTVATTLAGMGRAEHVRKNVDAMEMKIDRSILDTVLSIIRPAANVVWQEGLPENYDDGSVPQQS